MSALTALGLGTERFVRCKNDPQRSWVSSQLKLLRVGTPDQRRLAIEQLAAVRIHEFRRVAPALADQLGNADPEIRRRAAEAFIRLAGENHRDPRAPLSAPLARSIPALARALSDENPATRVAACRALGKMGWLAGNSLSSQSASARALEPAMKPLATALADPNAAVRAEAARASVWVLPAEGGAPPALLAAVVDPDAAVRECALQALARRWQNQTDVERAVLPILARSQEPDRHRAAMVLAAYGPPSPDAINVMLDLLGKPDTSWWTRTAVINALASYGPAASRALPALRASAIEPATGQIDYGIARAMTAIDPLASETLEVLQLVAERGVRPMHGGEAEWAAPLLRASGPATQALLPWIRGQAACDDPEARASASRLLAELGESDARGN